MKKQTKALLLTMALVGSTLSLTAQDADGPPSGGSPHHQDSPDGPRGPGIGRRPPPPLMLALDENGDGTIDEQEIANASAALKKLDTNGDGKLTLDELRPPRPPHGEPAPGRQGIRRPPHAQQPGSEGLEAPKGPPAEQ